MTSEQIPLERLVWGPYQFYAGWWWPLFHVSDGGDGISYFCNGVAAYWDLQQAERIWFATDRTTDKINRHDDAYLYILRAPETKTWTRVDPGRSIHDPHAHRQFAYPSPVFTGGERHSFYMWVYLRDEDSGLWTVAQPTRDKNTLKQEAEAIF